MNRPASVAAVLSLAAVLVVTVSPLQVRPKLAPPQVERFGAWALIGVLSAFAYPRRAARVTVIVAGLALGSELSQFAAPGRHPRVSDAAAKSFGAIVGALFGFLLQAGARLRQSRPSTADLRR